MEDFPQPSSFAIYYRFPDAWTWYGPIGKDSAADATEIAAALGERGFRVYVLEAEWRPIMMPIPDERAPMGLDRHPAIGNLKAQEKAAWPALYCIEESSDGKTWAPMGWLPGVAEMLTADDAIRQCRNLNDSATAGRTYRVATVEPGKGAADDEGVLAAVMHAREQAKVTWGQGDSGAATRMLDHRGNRCGWVREAFGTEDGPWVCNCWQSGKVEGLPSEAAAKERCEQLYRERICRHDPAIQGAEHAAQVWEDETPGTALSASECWGIMSLPFALECSHNLDPRDPGDWIDAGEHFADVEHGKRRLNELAAVPILHPRRYRVIRRGSGEVVAGPVACFNCIVKAPDDREPDSKPDRPAWQPGDRVSAPSGIDGKDMHGTVVLTGNGPAVVWDGAKVTKKHRVYADIGEALGIPLVRKVREAVSAPVSGVEYYPEIRPFIGGQLAWTGAMPDCCAAPNTVDDLCHDCTVEYFCRIADNAAARAVYEEGVRWHTGGPEAVVRALVAHIASEKSPELRALFRAALDGLSPPAPEEPEDGCPDCGGRMKCEDC